jgi:hypothetical protein
MACRIIAETSSGENMMRPKAASMSASNERAGTRPICHSTYPWDFKELWKRN